MSVQLKLKAFEGPLDLLCHLIRVNEIDIYDIPIMEITRQYMAYVKTMQAFNMEITSEFLVMASTLMEIKSRSLLPAAANKGGGEGEEAVDPRRELVNQLLEYQLYQQVAFQLQQHEKAIERFFFKQPEDLSHYLRSGEDEGEPLEIRDTRPEVLVDSFRNIMRTFLNSRGEEKQQQVAIPREVFTVSRQSHIILETLDRKKRVAFSSLFKMENRTQMIVTFLSLLELMRTGEIWVMEEMGTDDLMIHRKGKNKRNAG